MELKFKKGKNPEIQMDKLMLNFFLKINEESDIDIGNNYETRSVNSSIINDETKKDTFTADNVYLRLSSLLN